jgi:hypothetical protein
MKCIYYLTSTLDSTSHITDDLHEAGIGDWFIHVLSKDEAGLSTMKIHSSNYLEQLDTLRFGIIGAVGGFVVGLLAAYSMNATQLFGSDVPSVAYYALIGLLAVLGAWEGGLTGIASENKKIALFHDEIEAGKYLIMIYARQEMESIVKAVMGTKHPEAELVAEDEYFYNPLSGLKRI